MFKHLQYPAALVTALILTACGGGGGSSSAPPINNPPPLPTNNPPTATSASILTDEGLSTDFQLSGSDIDGDPISFLVSRAPQYGLLQVDPASGQATYSPELGSSGTDSFAFVTDDGEAQSSAATVSIDINRRPAATPSSLAVSEVQTYEGLLKGEDPDNDLLTFTITTAPSLGAVQVVDASTGQFAYTAINGAQGTDTFDFLVDDGRLESSIATVQLSIVTSIDLQETQIVYAADPTLTSQFATNMVMSGAQILSTAPGVHAVYVFSQDNNGAWVQAQKLLPDDPNIFTYFGRSLAANEDTLVIGEMWANDNGPESGAAYVYSKQPDGTWIRTARLLPSDGAQAEEFGTAVGTNGNSIAVSSVSAVYVFERDQAGAWTEKIKLPQSDRSGRVLTREIDMTSEHLALGQPDRTTLVSTEGAVVIYHRSNDGVWSEEALLAAGDRNSGSEFGSALDLSESQIAIGAHRQTRVPQDSPDYTVDDNYVGAVYVFERDNAGAWSQTARLIASDVEKNWEFGTNVAIEADVLIVSSGSFLLNKPRHAYIYRKSANGNWIERGKLFGSDNQAGSGFGSAVLLQGSMAAIGAFDAYGPLPQCEAFPGQPDSPPGECGAFYVFDVGIAVQ